MTKLLKRESVWFPRLQEYAARLWSGWYMACAGEEDGKLYLAIVNINTRKVKRLVLYKRQVLCVVSPETTPYTKPV